MIKKIFSTILFFVTVFSLLVMPATVMAADDAGVVFYVATDGSNENPGTFEAPFANIIGARDAIRELKAKSGLPAGGITVYIRGGEYITREQILFEEQDSGTEESPIMYKAYNGEEVVLNGGVKIDGKDFMPVTDNDMLGRLDVKVRKKVLCVDLYDYIDKLVQGDGFLGDIKDANGKNGRFSIPGMEVFVDDEKYVTARYPNVGDDGIQQFINVATIVAKRTSEVGTVFSYTDTTPLEWQDSDNIWIMGDFPATWGRCESVIKLDREKSQVSMVYIPEYNPKVGNRFCFTNVFEELDKPGEYYIDYNTGMLYIYPKSSIRQSEVGLTYFSASDDRFGTLIKMMHASNITLSGIDVTLCRNSGVFIKGGKNNLLINCEISNIGMTGVGIGEIGASGDGGAIRGWGLIYTTPPYEWGTYFKEIALTREAYEKIAGYNHGIVNCVVKNTGHFGVGMYGGDRIDLEDCGYYLYNSLIEKTGRNAVAAIGCGLYVGHNTIRRTPEVGVEIGGNNTIVEYNDISDTCYEGNDLGAIYSSQYDAVVHCGTEVRYNYIHDLRHDVSVGDNIEGFNGDGFRVGVYMDMSSNFMKVHHNIFHNVPFGTFGLGSEYDVYDNVFLDVNNPINTRLEPYMNKYEVFEENWAMRELNFFKDNEIWKKTFPEVNEYFEWLKSVGVGQGRHPKNDYIGNLMVYNTNKNRYKEGGFILDCNTTTEQNLTIENNQYVISDPGFVDIRGGNLDFKADSKAVAQNPELGKIEHSKMGRNKDLFSEIVTNSVVLMVGEQDALTFGTSAMVDSSNANVAPVIIDSRTLVPVRFISEAFGCEVGWDAATQTVTITKDGKVVTMQIGSNTITVDGVSKEIDVSAQIIESRTMVPLRVLTEALGKEVFWDDRGLIVISDESEFLNSEEDKEIIDKLVEYVNCY